MLSILAAVQGDTTSAACDSTSLSPAPCPQGPAADAGAPRGLPAPTGPTVLSREIHLLPFLTMGSWVGRPRPQGFLCTTTRGKVLDLWRCQGAKEFKCGCRQPGQLLQRPQHGLGWAALRCAARRGVRARLCARNRDPKVSDLTPAARESARAGAASVLFSASLRPGTVTG